MSPRPSRALVLLVLALANRAVAGEVPRFEFTRLVAHWAEYGDPDYLKFIEEARPDVAQVGFYGAHFWSLGHTAQYDGYPAHFPVRGLDALGKAHDGFRGGGPERAPRRYNRPDPSGSSSARPTCPPAS